MVHLRLIKEWGIKSNWKKVTNLFGERNFALQMRSCSMHPRIRFFSFWELMGVLNIFWFCCSPCLFTRRTPSCQSYVSHQVPNVWTPKAFNAFLACSQAPNVFPKMFTIAHHTLSHNFRQSWTINVTMPNMKQFYHYILEVQTFYWGWSCSNSKVSNYFWNSLVCISQLVNRTNNRWFTSYGCVSWLRLEPCVLQDYLKTLCIIGTRIICQTRTICQAL
jgi:hypothetical protein